MLHCNSFTNSARDLWVRCNQKERQKSRRKTQAKVERIASIALFPTLKISLLDPNVCSQFVDISSEFRSLLRQIISSAIHENIPSPSKPIWHLHLNETKFLFLSIHWQPSTSKWRLRNFIFLFLRFSENPS